jgi:hypothetical protein
MESNLINRHATVEKQARRAVNAVPAITTASSAGNQQLYIRLDRNLTVR